MRASRCFAENLIRSAARQVLELVHQALDLVAYAAEIAVVDAGSSRRLRAARCSD